MNILLESRVIGAHHESIGIVIDVIISQATKEITHLVVEEETKAWARVVPVSCVVRNDAENKVVELNIHKDAILFFETFVKEDYHRLDFNGEYPGLHPYKGYVLTHKPEGENKLSRRKFLITANLAIVLAMVAGLFYPFVKYLLYPMYAGLNNTWFRIGGAADIPTEQDAPKLIKFIKVSKQAYMTNSEEKSHWIINASPELIAKVYGEDGNRVFKEQNTVLWENKKENNLIVYSGKCTHLGCPYRWDEAKKQFICPCHISIFDMEGKVLSGPAPRRLDTLPVKIEDSQIFLIDAEYKSAVGKKERIA